jgi:hypothetical protein
VGAWAARGRGGGDGYMYRQVCHQFGLLILPIPMVTAKGTCTRLRHQSLQHSHLSTIVLDYTISSGPNGRQSKNHINLQLSYLVVLVYGYTFGRTYCLQIQMSFVGGVPVHTVYEFEVCTTNSNPKFKLYENQ